MSKILDFLRTSSLWIAIGASFGPIVISQIYGLPLPRWVPVAVFLATWAVYAIDKVSGSQEDLLNTPERAWLAAYPIEYYACASYGLAIFVVVAIDLYKFITTSEFMFWNIAAILSFGVAGRIYTKKVRGHRLKDIPCAKNVIVALATSICYCGLLAAPFAAYVLIFMMIWIGTVIFDLRDVVGDTVNQVRTIPVIFGRGLTLLILTITDIPVFLISPIAGLIIAIEIVYFGQSRPNWQYDIFCDGWFIWIAIVIESVKYL